MLDAEDAFWCAVLHLHTHKLWSDVSRPRREHVTLTNLPHTERAPQGEHHPASFPGQGDSGTGDRCAIAIRRREASKTRRLPVSSSSCAMSLRSAGGVSAAAGWVNLHSRVPRPRVRSRNDSRWQHVTFASSVPTQYPVAQLAQDQFFDLAGLLNQP
jgi:hypothetical protein